MNQPSGSHGNVLHAKIYLSCFFFLLLFAFSQLLFPSPIPILTIFTVILPSLTAPEEVSDNSLYLVQQEDLGKVSQMDCSELVSFNTDTCPILPDLLTDSKINPEVALFPHSDTPLYSDRPHGHQQGRTGPRCEGQEKSWLP